MKLYRVSVSDTATAMKSILSGASASSWSVVVPAHKYHEAIDEAVKQFKAAPFSITVEFAGELDDKYLKE